MIKIKTQHTDHFVAAGFSRLKDRGSTLSVAGLVQQRGRADTWAEPRGGFDDQTLKDVLKNSSRR
jgi:hypothetical protein